MNDLHNAIAHLCVDNINKDDDARGAQDQPEGPGDRQPPQHLPPRHGPLRERF